MAGIWVADKAGWPMISIGLLLAGSFLTVVYFRRNRMLSRFFWLLTAACLGAFLFARAAYLPAKHIVYYRQTGPKEQITLKGIVLTDADSGGEGATSFIVKAKEACATPGCRSVEGLVSVMGRGEFQVGYGDEVLLQGRLHRPFDTRAGKNLSWRETLRRRGVRVAMSLKKAAPPRVVARGLGNPVKRLALASRRWCISVHEKYLLPGEAGMMSALMLGERRGIPEHVRDLFTWSGTAHIVAVSGLNISMLAFGFLLLARILPVPRRVQLGLAILAVVHYTMMAGLGPPVVRAGVMSVIFFMSFMLERESDALNTLAAAAFAMLALDPFQLFDIGFQLSFICVLSLICGVPLLLKPLKPFLGGRSGAIRFMAEGVAVSLAATLASQGLVAFYFEMITPVALVSNLVAVPLVALVTALGAGLLVAAAVFPPAAVLFAACLKAALNLMVGVLWLSCRVPGGSFNSGEIGLAGVTAYYIILLAGSFWAWKAISTFPGKTEKRSTSVPGAEGWVAD